MDLHMPEMDGITATKVLRSNSRFEKLPIIAMTAHALVEERQRCLDAGMNDHVSKPIDPDKLFSTLLRWAKPTSQAKRTQVESSREIDHLGLPRITGINLADGLKRVAGNRRLYSELLLQFVTKQGEAATQIAGALDNRDFKLAEQIAHTVKGVAGNLGITHVYEVATKLEKGIREGHDSVPALVDQLAITLRSQVGAINQAVRDLAEAEPSDVEKPSLDKEDVVLAIDRLKALLEASDGDAPEGFRILQRALSGVVEKEYLDALADNIRDFDFEAALVKLNEIVRLVEEDRKNQDESGRAETECARGG
jgi:CheY-like chemotaxis protein